MRPSKSKGASGGGSDSAGLTPAIPPPVNFTESAAVGQPSASVASGVDDGDGGRTTYGRRAAAAPQPPSRSAKVSEGAPRTTSSGAVSRASRSGTSLATNLRHANGRTLQTRRLFSARQLPSNGALQPMRHQQRRASLSDVAERRRCGGSASRRSGAVKNNGSTEERAGKSSTTQGDHHLQSSPEADELRHHYSITDWSRPAVKDHKDSLESLTSDETREDNKDAQRPFPRLLSTIRAVHTTADAERGRPLSESERQREPLRMKELRFSRPFCTQESLDDKRQRRSRRPTWSERCDAKDVAAASGEDGKTNPRDGNEEPSSVGRPHGGQPDSVLPLMSSGGGGPTNGDQVASTSTHVLATITVTSATAGGVASSSLSNNNKNGLLSAAATAAESSGSPLENGATPTAVAATTPTADDPTTTTAATAGKRLSRLNGLATKEAPQQQTTVTASVRRSPLTNLFARLRRQRRHNSVLPLPTTATALGERSGGAGGGGSASTSADANNSTAAAATVADDCETIRRVKMMWSRVIFDANENHFYYWMAVVSTVYVYNLLVVIARTVFVDLGAGYLWILWLAFDVTADLVYLGDMFVRSRTGYLEQGLLIRDGSKILALYFRSVQFKLDVASILPLDYAFQMITWQSAPYLRLNRLLKRERLQKFMEQTETRSALPNAFRVGVVVWYIAIIIHWNACLYFMISESIGLGSDGWVYGKLNGQSLPENVTDTLTRRYIYSFYWSTLILTTIGEVPGPQQNIEYTFVTVDLMCGVLIFATIVGNVGSMISNMSAARTDFQNRIDGIKQYMELRKVGKQLEIRVIKWFDYLWANKQNLADQQVLKVLPDKLQAEIAMHVHFETLRKVRIFQDCEAGLLAELVLKLQLQVFSPMDYVCRKGDIGREMYIVKRGMLQVVNDDGSRVFATLSEGAVFGELSILNIAGSKNGNRRTANVRSLGYTDLFVLNKNDLWVALKEYPEARKILIQRGRELLRKDNLLDENAPEENKTAEEIAEELQQSVRIVQTRIARLTAEHLNTESKLRERIAYLERKLGRYGVTLRRQQRCSDTGVATSTDDDETGDSEEARDATNRLPPLGVAERPPGVSTEP